MLIILVVPGPLSVLGHDHRVILIEVWFELQVGHPVSGKNSHLYEASTNNNIDVGPTLWCRVIIKKRVAVVELSNI